MFLSHEPVIVFGPAVLEKRVDGAGGSNCGFAVGGATKQHSAAGVVAMVAGDGALLPTAQPSCGRNPFAAGVLDTVVRGIWNVVSLRRGGGAANVYGRFFSGGGDHDGA